MTGAGEKSNADGQRVRTAQALIVLLCLCLLGLIGRLVYINTKMAPELRAYSDKRQSYTITLQGTRGVVLDRRFRVLAGSADQFAVYADPMLIPNHAEAASQLAPVLALNQNDILNKLDHPPSPSYVVLCRTKDNPDEAIDKLQLRGVGVQREPSRVYPMGKLAAHVIGYVGKDGKGLEGIESTCESLLKSQPGKRTVYCDVHRSPVFEKPDSYVPPRNGVHVVLTIDANIQEKLEEQLAERVTFHDAECAVGVVMNPKTGEVLALANYPTFDPTEAGKVPADVRRNRVLTDPVEPGSVFKSYVMSAVMTHHAARRDEVIDCHGGLYMVRSRALHDSHPYGALTVDYVLAKSSNIGMAILGQRLGNANIFNMLRDFGFGGKTGIDLVGEDAGLMNPLRKWTWGSTLSVPMGQEIAVTPIQLITAFSAIVNGGHLMRPKVVAAIVDDKGEIIEDRTEPVERRQVLDPEISKTMIDMLTVVCKDGTGKTCKLDHWQALGKTGTAQIPRIGKGRHGYEPGQYLASFIGAAPASDPAVVALVMVRHPRKNNYYGGVVSLPAVREVLNFTLSYLNVPYDPEPTTNPDKRQVALDKRH